MAVGWMLNVPQSAIINEAEQFAIRHLSDAMDYVRPIYATVQLDIVDFALTLQELATAARIARAASKAAQGRYEVEAAQARKVVKRAKKWLDVLQLAARHARRSGHPRGKGLEHLFAKLDASSWSKSMNAIVVALTHIEHGNHPLTTYGLPADFVEQGKQLAADLRDENQDAADALMLRRFHAERLHDLVEDIVAELERLSAARDLAMALTGEDLPGLELTIARGAAASRGEPATTEPATGL